MGLPSQAGGVKKVLNGAYLLKVVFFLYLLGVVKGGVDTGCSMVLGNGPERGVTGEFISPVW